MARGQDYFRGVQQLVTAGLITGEEAARMLRQNLDPADALSEEQANAAKWQAHQNAVHLLALTSPGSFVTGAFSAVPVSESEAPTVSASEPVPGARRIVVDEEP